MAKKTTKKSVVTPNPKNAISGALFDDLSDGDYFIMDGTLWQRVDETECEQAAINSLTGKVRDYLCDNTVIPVTVTITWELK